MDGQAEWESLPAGCGAFVCRNVGAQREVGAVFEETSVAFVHPVLASCGLCGSLKGDVAIPPPCPIKKLEKGVMMI